LYERLLRNHVLTNLAFVLVMVMGVVHYQLLPREQDPTINFNWIQVQTFLPGASAEDVEKLVTDPLEEALTGLSDIRFVSSTSRESVSSILVRFNDLAEREFDKRVTDLRREIQAKANSDLPDEAEDPFVQEITTANAYPTATLVVAGDAAPETLRREARRIERDLERLTGVDRVDAIGLRDPELQVLFDPERVTSLGLSPVAVADSVARYFRDTAGGTLRLGEQEWLLRLVGKRADPDYLASIPLLTTAGEVPLDQVAEVVRAREDPDRLVSFGGAPAVMMMVFKQPEENIIELVARLRDYIDGQASNVAATGIDITLVDDQTTITRAALSVMERNALLGLSLVLLVTWLFLGSRIALLTSIGIPFTLAGTFWVLGAVGMTLNVMVLLGVVICLGMIVDDAVVVVEAIYYRMTRGQKVIPAALDSLNEVFAPVTTSVLTTMAAFSPLMLMPGIVGKFMLVVPLVVTTALAISLLEAYWMLPAHVHAFDVNFKRPGRVQRARTRAIHWIRVSYTRVLIRVLRRPRLSLGLVLLFMAATFSTLGAGMIRFEFFAFDPVRLFYVNVEMPAGTSLDKTLERIEAVERRIRSHVRPGEVREMVGYSGLMLTETEPLIGDNWGQLFVSLNPRTDDLRTVDQMIAAARDDVLAVPGPENISFLRISGGPPTARPIKVKVRGDDFAAIRAAVADLKAFMATEPAIFDVADDDREGRRELALTYDFDAVRRSGLDPGEVARLVRLAGDGEVVASLQHQGEKVEVRVRAQADRSGDVDSVLRQSVVLADGGEVALGRLLQPSYGRAMGSIKHYNFRRAITVEADIDKLAIDTREANRRIQAHWEEIRERHPGIDLDFTGELDDIQESLDSIAVLFVFGVGLIYLILGTQFRSYFQPLMILVTVPMAFTGVILGLLITDTPLSLFTLYGIVALSGIAVNSAIVLISAGNARLRMGMSPLHATLYAARRRVIPVLITSLTTVAGLFSLATGLGGKSLLWGPVATAIVWGLIFSTVLTLLMVPLLFRVFMGWSLERRARRRAAREALATPGS
jgi:multidrug efflux pump subunit AcrB